MYVSSRVKPPPGYPASDRSCLALSKSVVYWRTVPSMFGHRSIGHGAPGLRAESAGADGDEVLVRNSVRERLAYLLVVERLALRVEEHEVRVEARARVDDELGVRLEGIDLVASHLVDGVDRAGLQQLTLRAGVTHELDDDLLELVVLPAAPPVRIRREDDLLVGSVRFEHVGSGAGLVALVPPGLVLALGRGAEHPEPRSLADMMRSIGAGSDRTNLTVYVVDDLDFLDRAEQVGGAQIQLHRAVDGVLRRLPR